MTPRPERRKPWDQLTVEQLEEEVVIRTREIGKNACCIDQFKQWNKLQERRIHELKMVIAHRKAKANV